MTCIIQFELCAMLYLEALCLLLDAKVVIIFAAPRVAHNSIRLNCHFARRLMLPVITFISRGRWNALLWSPCLWSVIMERN